MDCKWSAWGKWSLCSKSCGNGLQERNRTKATKAKHGGKECAGSNNERISCNNGNCPGTTSSY